MGKVILVMPAVVFLACAQESAFQEIENKGKKSSFQETLEIRDVRESSARDVGEALSKVEGLWKVRKGGIANDVVLRGFQSDNLNVLVDGVRIYGACPNHMDPPAFHVDFAEIQQVDIVKGAFDVKNQGSLGGVVNIINKRPANGLRVTPNFAGGSFGFFNPSLTASYTGDGFYFLAGQSFRRSAPYRDGSGRRFTEWANYRPMALDQNAFDINTYWGKAGLEPRKNHRAEFFYTRQGGDQVLYPYLMMDAVYDNADRASATYTIQELPGPVHRFRAEGYFTRVKHWMTDERRQSSVNLARPYSMATFASTRAAGGRLEAELASLSVGVESYYRNWDAVNTMRMGASYMDQPAIPNVGTTLAGAYADYGRLFLEKLQVNAGVRLDRARSEANSATLSTNRYYAYKGTRLTSATDTNPSANLRVAYTLPKGFQVFSGIGLSARLPSAQERYLSMMRSGADWVGNPLLKPTRNREADLGFVYRHRKFHLRPTLFYSRLADYITVQNQPRMFMAPGIMSTLARSYENVDARIYGGELSYNVGLSRQVLLFGGLSYTRGIKDAIPARMIFSRNLAEMPPLKSRLALRYGSRLFFGEIEGVAAAAQDRVDLDLREARTPGYGIVNLKAGVHNSKLQMSIGLDNVTNRFYYEACSYQRDPFRTGVKVPEPGRSLYVSAAYNF